jgi:2-polyprenyl-6-methoxyphenol hydroxylase-like FAD-dependent oxidoreductase
MMDGRVAIIGDSAAIPRPHTAASTSKAAANALALADELQALPDDIPAALARWEPDQVALGKYLHQRGSQTGDYLLFQRPRIATVG